jgi:succinyl-CoA synthetase beta subunit
MNLDIPAVIRLGGNTEDRAVEILQASSKGLPANVEGFKKTDPPAKIAARFAALVAEHQNYRQGADTAGHHLRTWTPRAPRRPSFVGQPSATSFPVKAGRVWLDPAAWSANSAAIISRSNGLLRDDNGRPALAATPEAFLAKDSDMIACEVDCRRDGIEGVFVELDIPGLGREAR